MEFRAPLSRELRHLGLTGNGVTVSLGDGGIELAGTDTGRVLLPLGEIARLRVGFEEARSGVVPLLRLWRRGEPGSLLLVGSLDRAAYAGFVRALVARLLAERPDVPVETGSGLFVPIFVMGSFGLMALAAGGFSIWLAAIGESYIEPLGALAVAGVLLAILAPWTLSRYVPRRIARVEDVERGLFGC
jgi:hypothetical protein